ncbi:hypothetical protein BsWGS_01234 [Bradybaena similaris]
MSALGFEVHVDKENAAYVPGINKGGPVKAFSGLKEVKGQVQSTARKALLDVKQANIAASRNVNRNKLDASSTALKDACFSAVKPSKISNDAENHPHCLNIKQQDFAKPLSLQKKGLRILNDTEIQPPKVLPSTKFEEPKTDLKQEPVFAEEEYDPAYVFPEKDRLSNYVDKLISLRLPCLIGPLTESDSEDSEYEELLNEELVFDIPNLMPEIPEFSDADLDTLMDDIPPPEPDFVDS